MTHCLFPEIKNAGCPTDVGLTPQAGGHVARNLSRTQVKSNALRSNRSVFLPLKYLLVNLECSRIQKRTKRNNKYPCTHQNGGNVNLAVYLTSSLGCRSKDLEAANWSLISLLAFSFLAEPLTELCTGLPRRKGHRPRPPPRLGGTA